MLFKKIKTDQLTYRKNKDKVRADVLTTLIGELQTKSISEGTKEISDELCLKTIKNFLDGNKEMMEVKPSDKLIVEAEVLSGYMPTQMTEDEIRVAVVNFIKENNVERNMKNMGSVMGFLKKEFPSKFDGTLASTIVKKEMMS